MLRGVARRIDAEGNSDGQVTKAEAQDFIDNKKLVSSYIRPTFIIGDIFPFLDSSRRTRKEIGKEIDKAERLLAKL